MLPTQLEQLWDHQATLRSCLRDLCRKERYRKSFEIARSLPGIGWFTAIRLVPWSWERTSPISASGKKIASFIGLNVQRILIGKDRAERPYQLAMAQGSSDPPLLRTPGVAIRRDPALLSKFLRISRANGSRKKAIARMLIVRLRACLISGVPYKIGVVQ